mmetsp:Transcript_14921/g.41926  ORF Transcript_14921/g.41926 Transcript_14921/m.41926 type:complete len:159 (+) Transcript_14921:161-637(+)
MSGVERAGYMDNIRSAALTEQIGKELSIQKNHFKRLDEEGKLPPPLTPLDNSKRLGPLDTIKQPEYVTRMLEDPEQKILTRMSASIWMSNPGYLVRDGINTVSVAKSDYVWDQEEIDFMKASGELDKAYHMRKTDQSAYVEARARQRNLMKGPGSTGD